MIKTTIIENEVEHELVELFHARKNARTKVERDSIDNQITVKSAGLKIEDFRRIFKDAGFKLSSKYTPHQGSRERLRRLARIYHSHPHDCLCKSCEMMDGMLKSRGMME